jgi:type IV pilus assembly protein PilC
MTEYQGGQYPPDNVLPPKPGVAAAIAREIMWIVVSVVILGLLTGALSLVIDQTSGMVPLTALLMLFAIAMITRAFRRRRAMLAISYMEQAVRQNLPIPLMLGAAEQTESGMMRSRLGQLRIAIEGGASISNALAATMPGFPLRSLGLIGSGERLGRLAPALTRLVRHSPRIADDRDPANMIYLRWYPLMMMVGLTGATALITTFVLPKYQMLFEDFGLPLPRVSAWVLDVYRKIAIPLFVGVAIVFAIVCGRTVAGVFPGSGRSYNLWRWLTDRLAWITPIWRGITRNRGMADVCHIVAEGLEVGQPLDRALIEAAEGCTNLVLHRRIARWAQFVTTGIPVDEAARRANLPALVSNLLRTAHGPDGARDVFRFLARYYDSRHSAAAAVVQGAAIPVMVAVFGIAVASLALAMFLPLVRLMQHLPVTGRLL